MARFSYKALNASNVSVSGTIVGDNSSAVSRTLREQNLMLLSLNEVSEPSFSLPQVNRSSIHSLFVSKSNIIFCFTQLSSMLRGGITLVRAMTILKDIAPGRSIKVLIQDMLIKIESGYSLSKVMSEYPLCFPSHHCSLVEAGELTGILDTALDEIVELLERRQAFKSHMISALTYPSIVSLATIGVIYMLVAHVIPAFEPFLIRKQASLEWNTQFLLNVNVYVQEHGSTIASIILTLIISTILFFTVPTLKKITDRVILYIPLVGHVIRFNYLVQINRTLSSLVASGIPLVDAFKTVQGVVKNDKVLKAIENIRTSISSGASFADSLQKHESVFPKIMINMIRVGNETGNIDGHMRMVAEIYETAMKRMTTRIQSLIEPAVIILLAGIVGFVIWSLVSGIMVVYGL